MKQKEGVLGAVGTEAPALASLCPFNYWTRYRLSQALSVPTCKLTAALGKQLKAQRGVHSELRERGCSGEEQGSTHMGRGT